LIIVERRYYAADNGDYAMPPPFRRQRLHSPLRLFRCLFDAAAALLDAALLRDTPATLDVAAMLRYAAAFIMMPCH